MNVLAFSLFLAIVGLTLIITYAASKRTKTTSDFYTADGSLTGWQNGMAIAGDYMSAASFLGIAGMVALSGFDGFFYSIGFLVAYLVVLYIVAEPLRNLGKYTMADMIAARFNEKKVRGVAALNTITISIIVFSKFDFSLAKMFSEMKTATPLGDGFLNPGNKFKNPLDMISLNLALVLGTAGLPHILIRFFTVKDAITARKSVIYATWIIGVFYIMTIFLGFGAAAFVGYDDIIKANAAGNMAAPLLAQVLGGDFLFAFVSAVAFATILAVVAGLVLS